MSGSRFIGLSTAAMLAMASGLPAPQARADGGLTAGAIFGIVVAAVKVSDYTYGCRAIALSDADGDSWDTDPAGITWNQYKTTSWSSLPHTGGWFTANTLAKASSNGSKGSTMVTRSSGSAFENGVGRAEVEYTPSLANVKGASYWGDGWSDASLLARHAPGPKSKGPNGGGDPTLVPWSASIPMSLEGLNALVSGDAGNHHTDIKLSVYAFNSSDSSGDPDYVHPLDTAIWSGVVLSQTLDLTLASGGQASFSLNGPLLSEGMFSGSGASRTLISPVMANIDFTMMIPATTADMDIRIELEVEQQAAGVADAPAPGALGLLGAASVCWLRRRRV